MIQFLVLKERNVIMNSERNKNIINKNKNLGQIAIIK